MFLTHLFLMGREGIKLGFIQEVMSKLKAQGPVGVSQLKVLGGGYGPPTHQEHQMQRPGNESKNIFVPSNHSLQQDSRVGERGKDTNITRFLFWLRKHTQHLETGLGLRKDERCPGCKLERAAHSQGRAALSQLQEGVVSFNFAPPGHLLCLTSPGLAGLYSCLTGSPKNFLTIQKNASVFGFALSYSIIA